LVVELTDNLRDDQPCLALSGGGNDPLKRRAHDQHLEGLAPSPPRQRFQGCSAPSNLQFSVELFA